MEILFPDAFAATREINAQCENGSIAQRMSMCEIFNFRFCKNLKIETQS
jgi:hypothetical protein